MADPLLSEFGIVQYGEALENSQPACDEPPATPEPSRPACDAPRSAPSTGKDRILQLFEMGQRKREERRKPREQPRSSRTAQQAGNRRRAATRVTLCPVADNLQPTNRAVPKASAASIASPAPRARKRPRSGGAAAAGAARPRAGGHAAVEPPDEVVCRVMVEVKLCHFAPTPHLGEFGRGVGGSAASAVSAGDSDRATGQCSGDAHGTATLEPGADSDAGATRTRGAAAAAAAAVARVMAAVRVCHRLGEPHLRMQLGHSACT